MPPPLTYPDHATIFRPFEEELEPTYAVSRSGEFVDGDARDGFKTTPA
jgi:hypothetical protein